jgi:hypothetical protein
MSPQTPAEPPALQPQHPTSHLTIELFGQKRWLNRLWRYHRPVQDEPFYPVLRITNRDNKVCPGAYFSELRFKDGQTSLENRFTEEFFVGSLNPNQTDEVRWSLMRTHLNGALWASCTVRGALGQEVRTYQHSASDAIARVNQWENTVFVESKVGAEQRRTNRYMLILTILTFLHGVWGLNRIVFGAFRFAANTLQGFASFLTGIGG